MKFLSLNKKEIAFYILRFGLVIVFFYFGINQILNYEKWIFLVPDKFLGFYINDVLKSKLVILNAIFDLLVGFSLLSGIFIRLFSILGFLHLLFITLFSLGFEPSGVRDLGLAFSLLSVYFLAKENKV